MNDSLYMEKALELARQALDEGEVPVGCVIVKNGLIVGTGRNRREKEKNVLAHAEIEAINEACRTLGGWRLQECELYVTLEPCVMCCGAIINARIKKVVFGAYDEKAGVCVSCADLFDFSFAKRPQMVGGYMENECSAILEDFFKSLREMRT